MKATGIVRRIDELGRVVIPKEIRRTLRIREGDPLEIFTDREGGVILKKYSPIGEMGEFARQFAEGLSRIVGHIAMISDRDAILAISGGSKREYMDRILSKEMEELMKERKYTQTTAGTALRVLKDEEDAKEYQSQTLVPIISEGEPIGMVLLVDKDAKSEMGEIELKVCQVAASFIGKQMEQ